MTRWAMVADLNRCVGCQTCTAACKHANATAPGVQWRKVLDIEAGAFPDVRRAFVPVGCMHCEDPPCLHVCPSTATRRRPDGIVTIDYDICIGCAYCAVACPYQARFKIDRPLFAYGRSGMRHEAARQDPGRLGVAQKCTFCVDRIDDGLERGLTPGLDAEATPACVASCIADALHFGDLEDPASNVSRLLAESKHFRMHEELGTGPGFYYLWEKAGPAANDDTPAPVGDGGVSQDGIAPWLQRHWDLRAASNFMGGGAGCGLLLFAAAAQVLGGIRIPALWLLAAGLVGAGLLLVWLEIGRPWRFFNVFRHPQASWMTRESLAAVPLTLFALAAAVLQSDLLALSAAAFALLFLFCQARILQASKGVPAWRARRLTPLVVVTGLAEGGGLFLLAGSMAAWGTSSGSVGSAAGVLALLVLRLLAWRAYRGALGRDGAPRKSIAALDRIAQPFELAGHGLAAGLILLGLLVPAASGPSIALGGFLAFAAGWLFKLVLITRAGFNQGFAVARMPARGAGTSAPGVKPGWGHA